jgi:signal recognition particle receptor subunit beta
LLADKALSSVAVLILCNKQDETISKGKSAIEQLLEKEMLVAIKYYLIRVLWFCLNFRNLIRKTRTSQLRSVDNSTSDAISFLGRTDKDFEFSQISQKISFAESSAKNNEIEQVTNFINSL